MKTIVICVLFATAALAADQFYNRPNNLVYNFEHHRIDQPPHVENRDEDINKYRNRPRTTPAPFHQLPGHHVPAHLPQETTPFPYAGPQIHNVHLPRTMPPPPAPKWLDLADGQQYHPTQTHRDLPPQMHNDYPTHNMQPRFTESNSHYTASPEVPANAYSYTGAQHQAPQSRGNHKFSWDDLLPAQQAPVTTTARAAILPQSHSRPVPTLSPWSGDNFGK